MRPYALRMGLLIQCDWCLCKQRRRDTRDIYIYVCVCVCVYIYIYIYGEHRVMTEAKIRGLCLQVKELQGSPATSGLRKMQITDFLLETSEGAQPCQNLDVVFFLKPPSLWPFVMVALGSSCNGVFKKTILLISLGRDRSLLLCGLFSSCREQRLLLVAERRPLTAGASLVAERRPLTAGASVVVASRL